MSDSPLTPAERALRQLLHQPTTRDTLRAFAAALDDVVSELACPRCGSQGPGWDSTCSVCGEFADPELCNECREPLGDHDGPYHPWCEQ